MGLWYDMTIWRRMAWQIKEDEAKENLSLRWGSFSLYAKKFIFFKKKLGLFLLYYWVTSYKKCSQASVTTLLQYFG